jgi:caffeoyl-CoA O-methyltransferase
MLKINSQLEEYILSHTSPEDRVLEELNRKTNLEILNPHMLSGHLLGKVLEMISKMIQPELILEIGTYTGYSAICLARGLREGGKLHTVDINDELEEMVRFFFKKARIEEKVEYHIGNALEIIPGLNHYFDLVFIDGDKREYCAYYNTVFDKVKSGGFILADNVLLDNKVIEKEKSGDLLTKGIKDFNNLVHNDPRVENVILPIRDGLTVLKKTEQVVDAKTL